MSRFIDSLENRQLFATVTLDADGLLTLTGSNQRDFMRVFAKKDSYVVELNGDAKYAYKKTQITGVVMWGFGGDDSLNARALRVPVTLVGGDGKDTINGGFADDILVGGPGNDKLDGRQGSDILRGDLGNDSLVGGEGDDYLFAGEGKNTITGSAGNDTILTTTGIDDTARTKTVESTQPDTFRPAGRLFPESSSLVSPTLTTVASNSTRDALVTVNYTLPTASARFLYTDLLRNRSRGEGANKQTALQLGVLALSYGGETAAPITLSASFTTAKLEKGNYFFALSSPEDPPKSSTIQNDFTFKDAIFAIS